MELYTTEIIRTYDQSMTNLRRTYDESTILEAYQMACLSLFLASTAGGAERGSGSGCGRLLEHMAHPLLMGPRLSA